ADRAGRRLAAHVRDRPGGVPGPVTGRRPHSPDRPHEVEGPAASPGQVVAGCEPGRSRLDTGPIKERTMHPDLKTCERVSEVVVARPVGWAVARTAYGVWGAWPQPGQ